jgi:hypothetical protein
VKTYKVCLHMTVSVWVTVEAVNSTEANRKAIEKAPKKFPGVVAGQWSPVMTCDMNRKSL